MRYLTTTKNLFDISNFSFAPSLGFDVSLLEIGKTYTFSSNKPILGLKISNSSTGYNSVQYQNSGGFTTFTFVMQRNSNIPETSTQFLFIYLLGLSPDYVTDISQLNGYNLQLEEGSTATPYVPYGYLPMRRMKYRVNEYCQLLDKSKFPATRTVNGVTWTNNGDGTITVNGTSTSIISVLINSSNLTKNNRYLLTGCPTGGIGVSSNWFYRLRCFGGIGDEYGNGKISYANETAIISTYIQINSGITVSNLVFKPQLFDLTEIYGAGNEPTTVEEFKQDYPNELYPYSPYCWARIKSLIYKDDIDYIKMK